jgi:hypothetical protein
VRRDSGGPPWSGTNSVKAEVPAANAPGGHERRRSTRGQPTPLRTCGTPVVITWAVRSYRSRREPGDVSGRPGADGLENRASGGFRMRRLSCSDRPGNGTRPPNPSTDASADRLHLAKPVSDRLPTGIGPSLPTNSGATPQGTGFAKLHREEARTCHALAYGCGVCGVKPLSEPTPVPAEFPLPVVDEANTTHEQ